MEGTLEIFSPALILSFSEETGEETYNGLLKVIQFRGQVGANFCLSVDRSFYHVPFYFLSKNIIYIVPPNVLHSTYFYDIAFVVFLSLKERTLKKKARLSRPGGIGKRDN